MLYTIVKNQNLLNKKQEENGLLSSLDLKTPLGKISLSGDFCINNYYENFTLLK